MQLQFDNMELFSVGGQRLAKRGRLSGGISIYIKKEVARYSSINQERSRDYKVWLLYDNQYEQIAMAFLYNPPRQSNFSDLDFFDKLEDDVAYWRDIGVEKLLLLGDFNSRTGTLADQVWEGGEDGNAREPIPEYYERALLELPDRINWDHVEDQNGKEMVNFVKATSLAILNGRITPELSNCFTYISATGKSVNDSVVASHRIYPSISRMEVVHDTYRSPHFPLSIDLELSSTFSEQSCQNERDGKGFKIKRYQWEEEKAPSFIFNFQYILGFLTIVCTMYTHLKDIDKAVSTLTYLIQHTAREMVQVEKQISTHVPRWFTSTCRTAKYVWQKALRQMRRNRNDNTIANVLEKKSQYHETIKEAKENYRQKEGKHY